jgi:hypothetical protein
MMTSSQMYGDREAAAQRALNEKMASRPGPAQQKLSIDNELDRLGLKGLERAKKRFQLISTGFGE